MTVCVAAICDGGTGPSSAIVTASDRLLTWGYSSSETALKAARLAPTWLTMIAGDDVTAGVEDVIRDARLALAEYAEDSPGIVEVQGAILGAWRNVQTHKAEIAVLNPFGLGMSEFTQTGRKRFGTATFLEMAERMRVVSKVDAQLLVCGFDNNQVPALLVCEDDVGCRDYTRADFVAIGSGHTSAIANLAFHGYTRECGIESAVYQVCAAKFMAERAPGVGSNTLVLCLRDDGTTKWIFKSHLQMIRDFWAEHGRPRNPTNDRVAATITPILEQQKWESA
jgi:hypothetical protein